MFSIDDSQYLDLEEDLKTFASRALPFANREAINRGAFAAQKVSRDFIKGRFLERNQFTRQSVQVDRARTLNIRHQEATVGSTQKYMETQEFGGTKVKKGKHGVPIPTSAASGEGKGVVPRRRAVKKPNRLGTLRLRKTKARGLGRKQKNRATILAAAAQGGRNRFVFLELGRRSGIYKVTGRKNKIKITMMYDLTRGAVTIPKTAWLRPAVDKIRPLMPRFYAEALKFQLKRRGLFE